MDELTLFERDALTSDLLHFLILCFTKRVVQTILLILCFTTRIVWTIPVRTVMFSVLKSQCENSLFFTDVDECEKKTDGCSHLCENIKGSFECVCPPGYKVSTDYKTCVGKCAIK